MLTERCPACGAANVYTIRGVARCPNCDFHVRIAEEPAVMSESMWNSLYTKRFDIGRHPALRRRPENAQERLFMDTLNTPDFQALPMMLLADKKNAPNGEAGPRDIAVIQQFARWLGTMEGLRYLEQCGFTHVKETAK